MRVRIATADGVAGNALYSWLRGDPTLPNDTDVSMPSPRADSMGALDVLDVVLTHATALGSLAVSVATWLGTRAEPPMVTITRWDGATLTIRDGTAIDAGLIEKFLNEGRGDADEGG